MSTSVKVNKDAKTANIDEEVLVKEKLMTSNASYYHIFWTVLGAMIAWIISLAISSQNIKSGYYDKVAVAKSNWIPNSSALLIIWFLAILFYGYASGRSYTADGSNRRAATLGLFVVQLILTILWFYFFFNAVNYQVAGIIAIIMLILVIVQIAYSWKFDRNAAWITILYAVWILIITIISWQLNSLNLVKPNQVRNAVTAVRA